MEPGANFVPSLREYTARWGITPERLRPGQKVMHPGPMNRGVEIDSRVADSPDVARSSTQVRVGARRRGWRFSTTSSPAARSACRRSPRRRWRDALAEGASPARIVVIRGARVLDPAEGIDATLEVRIDDGTIVEVAEKVDANEHRVDRRGRARARAGVRRPARPPAHAGPRGRGDGRERHRRRGGRRLLRDPRDAEHRSGRRLRRDARRARRDGAAARPRCRSASSRRSRAASAGRS